MTSKNRVLVLIAPLKFQKNVKKLKKVWKIKMSPQQGKSKKIRKKFKKIEKFCQKMLEKFGPPL